MATIQSIATPAAATVLTVSTQPSAIISPLMESPNIIPSTFKHQIDVPHQRSEDIDFDEFISCTEDTECESYYITNKPKPVGYTPVCKDGICRLRKD